jgi:hypothetical protein
MTTTPSYGGLTGNAATDLGLTGADLTGQLKDETAEQRKKRLLLTQQQQALGPAAMSLGLGANA